MSDASSLTLRQGKTYRVVFRMTDADNNPIPLTGYGATFQVLNRANGTVLILVDDTTPDPGDLTSQDPAGVVLEPGATPAIGEVHVRLGADQTLALTRDGVYDCAIYSKTDPTEVQPVASGPLVVLTVGSE